MVTIEKPVKGEAHAVIMVALPPDLKYAIRMQAARECTSMAKWILGLARARLAEVEATATATV